MSDSSPTDKGEYFFKVGKSYDLNQDSAPAAATLARAAFRQGAAMGHTPSLRALAGMAYYGAGGEHNPEQSFRLLWKAFQGGDFEALTELADMLGDYSESITDDELKNAYVDAEKQCYNICKSIERIEQFVQIRTPFSGVDGAQE